MDRYQVCPFSLVRRLRDPFIVYRIMDITQLPFNKLIGIQRMDPAKGICCLPEDPKYLNHIGTVSAPALFALAEASSGEFLLQNILLDEGTFIPILRKAEIKYRKPAKGAIYSQGILDEGAWELFHQSFARKKRAAISFTINLLDNADVVVASGNYEWFVTEYS